MNGQSLILLSDPQVRQIPVVDCGEPLAQIESVPQLRLDPRERDPKDAYGRVRAGVLDRLQTAAANLPDGTKLLIIEGHRTSTEQARRFSRYEQRLRGEGITDPAELQRQASAFVSPVEVAAHCAGAAVDLREREQRPRQVGEVAGRQVGGCRPYRGGGAPMGRDHCDVRRPRTAA